MDTVGPARDVTLAHPAALRGVLAAGFYLAGIAAAAVPQSPVFTRLTLAACGRGVARRYGGGYRCARLL